MANENISDEEYLDNLLNKITQDEDPDGAASSTDMDSLSDEELNAAAEEELQRMLQAGLEETQTETSVQDISIDQLLGNEELEEDGQDAGELSLDGLSGGSAEDLLSSLDSIVQEIKGDEAAEEADGTENKKRKASRKSRRKKNTEAAEAEVRENKFLKKIKNLFFKVEIVDLQQEKQEEEQRKKEKEEKKLAQAKEKEEAKAKKLEDKKAADARKKEAAQNKKQEKEKKRQERLARKAEEEAALGPEERVKLKPAFLAFMATVIAVLSIAVVLLSDLYSYQNTMNTAQRNFSAGKYGEAFAALSGVKLKNEDQMFYDQVHLLARLDKQYDAYVNYRNLNMPKEALNALLQGMTIYYDSLETAQSLNLEEEVNGQRETLLYSLSNDFGLNEDRVRVICELEDTNDYTREIELYSASQLVVGE